MRDIQSGNNNSISPGNIKDKVKRFVVYTVRSSGLDKGRTRQVRKHVTLDLVSVNIIYNSGNLDILRLN